MPRYRRSPVSTALILLIGLAIGVGQQRGWLHGLGQAATTNQPGSYSINHYVDGDTIAVNMNGSVETVRMIGVDTPETHKPKTPVQCYGPAAAAYTKNSISAAGGRVRLVSDSLSTDRDRYDRLLRYVYLTNGQLLEDNLIKSGYGFYYPYFPFSKAAQFAADQQLAMTAHKGLWGNCHPIAKDQGGYESNPQ